MVAVPEGEGVPAVDKVVVGCAGKAEVVSAVESEELSARSAAGETSTHGPTTYYYYYLIQSNNIFYH